MKYLISLMIFIFTILPCYSMDLVKNNTVSGNLRVSYIDEPISFPYYITFFTFTPTDNFRQGVFHSKKQINSYKDVQNMENVITQELKKQVKIISLYYISQGVSNE